LATSMRTFLVECYLPGIDERAVEDAAARALRATGELTSRGGHIAYLGATLVPADEVVFHTFAALDAAIVEAVSRTAGLAFERVVESTLVPAGPEALPMGAANVGNPQMRRGRRGP
jgi:hypothetical protein